MKKSIPSAGFRQVSVPVFDTEKMKSQCRIPSLQVIVRNPSLHLYLGVLGTSLDLHAPRTAYALPASAHQQQEDHQQ
jgi:hypothetical protein